MATDHTIAIFLAELILLLVVGRLLGEGLSRIGQPSIFGQLLAGVLLGPSVFGALAPELRQHVFPETPTLKSMIDGLSQVGILLLLLLTGMETNLALVNRKRKAVISTSVSGIILPFLCGVALAYALPASIMPSPQARLVTALFLGTALSVSSVKIVAMVLMEVGATRRDLGQLILATAILDNSIAWIIIAVIAGLAAHGTIDLTVVGLSLAGVFAFLAVSLTVGPRAVASVIRWTNDTMTIEFPVITAILVVMLAMALTTDLIGVHTVLGAFIAGLLIGQSPILTEHIDGELRGFIVAFFSPVFFAVAGLSMDVSSLAEPALIGFTLAIIAAASVGKFAGALVGGRFGGLTTAESLALATGLNARGSTEVIIANIGLSMGVLSNQLYTMIVAMAVVTTMVMPPWLRWAIARVPLGADETKRLEKEEVEERQSVPKMERALVYLDDSQNARLAAELAGIFAAGQQVAITIMEREPDNSGETGSDNCSLLQMAAEAAAQDHAPPLDNSDEAPARLPLSELIHVKAATAPDDIDQEIGKEIKKGYDLVIAGLDQPISDARHRFEPGLQKLVNAFDGPVAIALNGARAGVIRGRPLHILTPTGGASHARLATEISLALARATGGRLTALHVFDRQAGTDFLRGHAHRLGMSVLADVRQLGRQSGVEVELVTMAHPRPEVAIRRAADGASFDLVVIGAELRIGENRLLGSRAIALTRDIKIPTLLVAC